MYYYSVGLFVQCPACGWEDNNHSSHTIPSKDGSNYCCPWCGYKHKSRPTRL